MKKFFLFDLDGTVTDTGEGIMKSAQFALDCFGFPNEPEEKLRRFVGPPLDYSFREFYGLSERQAWEAVEKYRERYREKGVFESPLYPGMKELLQRLSQRAEVCLATSKPLQFARQIIELRGVAELFTVTVGANMDGTMTDKAQVIGEVLRQLGDPPKLEAVMIGDRRQDILGAKAQGVDSIGVSYGYAEAGELEAAGATHIVPTVEALEELCRKLTEE
ncbi:HAD hydrolase-like protein [uncultured Neglectibacter sp.]|uniref:HAD hydrolase-like protein n=1 Tax=uncultured Neglectibacter sp. TaxID=1924108 RepID=UPI0034DE5FC0